MVGEWLILVSYFYTEGTGLFCASIDVKEAPRDMNMVIVDGDRLDFKLYLYNKNLCLLEKKVYKVLEDTKHHVESLRYSIDSIPENKTYEF